MSPIHNLALLTLLAASLSATPALAHGGAYTPVGWGIPIPQAPGGPPTGPGPMTTGPGGAAPLSGGDPTGGLVSWRDWWHFNQDAFLDLRRNFRQAAVRTSSDSLGDALHTLLDARRSAEVVRGQLAPALSQLITDERSNELLTGALIALARCGDPDPSDPQRSLVPVLKSRLLDSSQEVAETSALALGILGDESALDLLAGLLADDAAGRALLGGGRSVPTRTRAFAAYSLGLMGEQARNNRTRQRVARALLVPLESPKEPQVDVQVACVIGLSIDRLDFERGEAQSANWVSRQSLVHYLNSLLTEARSRSLVRAHVANALALLVLDAPGTLRTEVEQALTSELRRGRQLENTVAESCIQGLGLLTDSDNDPLDTELRAGLARALDIPDQPSRFFGLIALGEAGGHLGTGVDSEKGRAECRNILVNELVRGRSRMRPWAALALGVQEFRVRGAGGEASAFVCSELRDWLRRESAPDEVGAGALALGLCRDELAIPLLRAKLDTSSPTDSQGYVALALGMIGARDALPELRAIVLAARYRPWILEPAATALALLGDRDIEAQLIEALRTTQSQSIQAALGRALGQIGDVSSVAPLLALARDTNSPGGTRSYAAIALGMLAERHDLPWHVPLSRDRNYLAVTPTLIGGDGQGVLEIF